MNQTLLHQSSEPHSAPRAPASRHEANSGRLPRLLGLVLVLVTVAVFGAVLGFDFVGWDDDVHLYANPRFQPLTWSNLLTFWQTPYEHLYIPLTYTVWAAVLWLTQKLSSGPASAMLFHGLNVLTHIANVMLVYRLGRFVLTRNGKGDTACIAAGAAAFLFGFHPLQVEAVAWVSGFKDVLSGFWSLLALWQYATYVCTSDPVRRRTHYGIATLAYVLALLAKPSAVVVPSMAWLLVTIALRIPGWRATRSLVPWLLGAVVGGFWTKGQQSDAVLAYVTPWISRPLIALDALAFYLWKLIWPFNLGVDYGRTPWVVLEQSWGVVIALVPLILGALVWLGRRQAWTDARLATSLLTAGLFPVLGLVPFMFQARSTVADRYMYLALLGPAIALCWRLGHTQNQTRARAICGLVLLLLGLRSAGQVRVWQNTVTLFTHALEVNPDSALAHNNLGFALAQRGKPEAAISHYQRALQLRPDFAYPHNNLGLVLASQGKLEEAVRHYQQAMLLRPYYTNAYKNLALTYVRQGKPEAALSLLRQARQFAPRDAGVYNGLGIALAAQDKLPEAIGPFAWAIQLQPNSANAYHNLGLTLSRQDRFQEAIMTLRKALQLDPSWSLARASLARVLATQPTPSAAALEEARTLAVQACLSTAYRDASALFALAMVQQASGHAEQAYRHARRALELAQDTGNRALMDQINDQQSALQQRYWHHALP
jgi:tetratricopeptide (TPR) repeat protein